MDIFDVKDLKKFLFPVTPANFAGVSLLSICKTKNIKEDHVCFINARTPLSEAKAFFEKNNQISPKKLIFIVDQNFYEKSSDEFNFLPSENIALTQKLDLVMCMLSKFFFELKYNEKQYLVDGRQTGKIEICPTARISQNVFIGENVKVGSNVTIMPGCVLMGDIKIGNESTLFPNCTIYPETTIGNNCIIHAGTVIGADGYGYNYMDGEHRKIWHIGGVLIGDHVEVGANCTIDRGTFDNTILENQTKLDNLVHIAHNCHLKKGVIVCAQSGLAGSVTIGNFSAMSGHVAVAPGVEIGDQCEIVGHSAVFENVDDKTRLAGSPARPMKEWLRSIAAIRRLTKK